MTTTKSPSTARLRLYQVNHNHLAPSTIVAASSGEQAIVLARKHTALGSEPGSAIAIDVTGEFEALSLIAREHTTTLLSAGRAEWSSMTMGTQAAREAGNMVDLDSDPTKLIEVVGLGKQLLMTRGALTTFSVANDVANYFAIIPAMFVALYPGLGVLNVMGLATPESAILSAIIFNALIIPLLVPLALKGVAYRPMGAGPLLARNLAVYGLGGLLAPFVGIKIIDLVVGGLGLA